MFILEGTELLKINENMKYGEQMYQFSGFLATGMSCSNCIPYQTVVSTKQAQPRPLHQWNTINVFVVSELQQIPLPTIFWIMLYVLLTLIILRFHCISHF